MAEDPVEKALRVAIQTSDSAEARLALGDHLARTGRNAEALLEYEAGIVLAPANRELLEKAASLAEATGDAAKAKAYGAALKKGGAETPAASPPARRGSLRVVARDGDAEVDEQPPINLAQVGGLEEVKSRLRRSFILPMQNPEVYRRFGKRIAGGLILYGPPGCGKTFLARAVAGEVGARFTNFGLADLWDGNWIERLHQWFENARRRTPTLVFMDEIDALGQRRTALKHAPGYRVVVNRLLAELDGMEGSNDGLFFLCATNHPWDIDPALRRPGRFDRLLFVPPPDAPAREQILRLLLEGRPHAQVDLGRLTGQTEGFSGADLVGLVDAATELAVEESVAAGKDHPVDAPHLKKALSEVKQSTRPWFEVARNYAVYANEGGVYDDLLTYLKGIGLG